MKFQPLSEVDVLNLLPAGEYDFVVADAKDDISKSGNEMIKLTLTVIDNMNRERTVYDYLLPSMMHKVRHFAYAVGLEKEYESGGYTAYQCKNKSGKCKIIVVDEPESSYPPRNNVKDYIKADASNPVKLKSPEMPKADPLFQDSDLPF